MVAPEILPLAVLEPLLSALTEEPKWALVRMRKTEGRNVLGRLE